MSLLRARLLAWKTSGKDPAEDVEVMIIGMQPVKPSARDGKDPELGGMMLHWSWTPDTTRAQIPDGQTRRLDLAYLRKKDLSANRIDRLWIRVAAMPKDRRNYVCWDQTRIDLLVTARNATPRRYRFTLRFDGLWTDNEEQMGQYFAIS